MRNSKKKYSSKKKEDFKGKREGKSKNSKFVARPSFNSKRNQPKPKKENEDLIRLNKFLSRAGVASRREADGLIELGLVEVNGKIVTELGYKVKPTDTVKYDGQTLKREESVYVLLNKPKGFIAIPKDKNAEKSASDLVSNASPYVLRPVDQLDRTAMGLVLMTNDDAIAQKISRNPQKIKEIYQVELDKPLAKEDLDEIREKGVRIDDEVIRVDSIHYVSGMPGNVIGVEMRNVGNRTIQRMFKRMGYEVEKLDRVQYIEFTKKNLPRGNWRILTEMEVNNLKMF